MTEQTSAAEVALADPRLGRQFALTMPAGIPYPASKAAVNMLASAQRSVATSSRSWDTMTN